MSPKEIEISRRGPNEVPTLRATGQWEITLDVLDWRAFDAIYLINLPERTDRRSELERELRRVALRPDDPKLVWTRAVRPAEAGEFPSVGARGCFLSHLSCLESAIKRGHQRILILEDDVHFPRLRVNDLKRVLAKLIESNWDIWYGGGNMARDLAVSDIPELIPLEPSMWVQTSHCIALQGSAIEAVRDFFELILTRPGGHAEAGPMHVDGAYCTWRRLNPGAITLVTVPSICAQRSSQSDIQTLRWFDKTPLVRNGTAALRRLRNTLSR